MEPVNTGRVTEEKPYWEGKHYSFFQNAACEYFPCHRIADPARFSCLFCYCPLYALGRNCGGDFRYTEKGIKDCTGCLIPHLPENFGRITEKYGEIVSLMRRTEELQKSRAEADAGTLRAENEGAKKTAVDWIVMAACTERGFATMGRAAEALAGAFPQSRILQTGRCADVPGFEDGPKLSDLAKEWFYRADALIFFTAAGIAVRCIAPYVEDKFRDPAVLSVDESGRFVIPLLSGHAGGANRIGQILAKALGAQAVITTATDGRGLFAVDTFAAENGLQLSDRTRAKEVSARLLAGKPIRIFREEGILPIFDFPENSDGAFSSAEKTDHTSASAEKTDHTSVSAEKTDCASVSAEKTDHTSVSTENAGVWETACRADADVIISCRRKKGDRADALYLIPPAVTLGIGCRRGAPAGNIQSAAEQALEEAGVFRQALRGIASIDLKKEEPGLLAFAEQWELPLTFFTAQELNAVPGAFSDSAFVREVAGVDCVCERGAVCLAGPGGRLLTHKQSFDGVTAALALAASGRMWPYA